MNPPADASPHGTDMVVRRGKIFECGSFPDKDFEMSEDELRQAAAAFDGPLPLDLEHIPTILDGKLGRVDSVWLSDDGRELHGSVSLPSWLDQLLIDGERKVSAEWHRGTKTLRKLSLVRNPRVKDAAIFAAFSVAHPDEVEALFATPRRKHDHATVRHQLIHDTVAMGYPAVCAGGPMKPLGDPAIVGMSGADAAYFADHPEQLKALRSIHSLTVQNGAKCSGKASMSDTPSRSDAMSDESKVKNDTKAVAFTADDFAALKAELDAEKARNAETAAKLAETSAAFSATQAALEAARIKQVAQDAAAFALAEIKAGRSAAAEYKVLVADFSEAAELDHKLGEAVTFSDATGAVKTGSRVEKLRAREAMRASHGLFSPALGDGELLHDGERLLFNDKPSKDVEAENRKRADDLLRATPEGRAILERRDSKSR